MDTDDLHSLGTVWGQVLLMWDLVTVLKKTTEKRTLQGSGILDTGHGWEPRTEHWCDLKAVCGMAVHTGSPETDSSAF